MLSNVKISRKIVLAFALVVVAALVMCGILVLAMQKLSEAQNSTLRSGRFLDLIDRMRGDTFDQMANVRAFMMNHRTIHLDGEKAQHKAFDTEAVTARDLMAGQPQVQPAFDAFVATHDSWQSDIGDPLLKMAQDPTAATQLGMLARSELVKAKDKDFRDKADALLQAADDWSSEQIAEAARATLIIKGVMLAGSLLTAAIAAAMGFLLNRAVGRPVGALTKVMRDLAAGRNDALVPGVGRRDEFGEMAQAVQTFKTGAIEKLRLEEERVGVRRQVEDERQRSENDRAEIVRQQTGVVQAIASGLGQLSNGALTFRIDQPFTAEYEALRFDFNSAMETLKDTMAVVTTSVGAIHLGTGEISTSAADLSRRTEQQAASLEETAAALDEITATVRKTAEGSNHARDVVGSAKTSAEQSGRVVRQAVEAMSGIEKSSAQIGNIIGVIDEIAFQTNLLALNAGVEAARAGEAGRGFAVVASEVRALAQRSAEAAKEIKALISASSAQVGVGVDLVGQTGKALERIVTQVTEINGIVTEIAASAREQATGLDQVNTAINQMDQVTQQNAAMVEESTAACQALAAEAEQLVTIISRFDVGGESPATKGSARFKRAGRGVGSSKPAAALKTAGRGGAAPKTGAQTDDWQEF